MEETQQPTYQFSEKELARLAFQVWRVKMGLLTEYPTTPDKEKKASERVSTAQ